MEDYALINIITIIFFICFLVISIVLFVYNIISFTAFFLCCLFSIGGIIGFIMTMSRGTEEMKNSYQRMMEYHKNAQFN